MDKIKRFEGLEFLRFLLAVGVCYAHLVPTLAMNFSDINFQTQILQSAHAVLAVPAFFIISGFFLSIKGELFDFVCKKIIRLWPVLAFSILIKISSGYDFLGLLFINDGLGLINKANSNAAIWYVCVLFWGLICFYLFLKHTEEKKQILPLILVSYFSLFLVCQWGQNSYNEVLIKIITFGVAWGVFGISFGILLRKVWSIISKIFENIKHEKLIFTLLETVLTAAFIYISAFYKGFLHPTCYILLFTVLFYVILLQKGYVSNAFGKINILGKYSYAIYLMQSPCFYYMRKYLWYNLNGYNKYSIILISLAIIVLCGIGVYYLIEVPFGKLFKKLYEKIKLRLENVNNSGEL